MNKNQLVVLLFFIANWCLSQSYLLPNEEIVFSFVTKNKKKMVLAKDKEDAYIVYRFGAENNIEIEFPEKNKESWNKFTYFYYGKPGGPENGGSYFHSINFKIKEMQYSVYSNVYLTNTSKDDYHEGVLIINAKTKKRKTIKAFTSEGTLDDFQYNNLLQFEDIENYE